MTVNDLPVDQTYQSGSSGLRVVPTIVQRQLKRDQVLDAGFTFYKGSGGVVATFFRGTTTGSSIQIHSDKYEGLANIISEIRAAFDLTKEELAKVCKVKTRKTIYNWVDGTSKPRKEAMSRVFDLLLVARAWSDSGFKASNQELHKRIVDQKSLFELLQDESLDKELIIFAGTRLSFDQPKKVSFSRPFA